MKFRTIKVIMKSARQHVGARKRVFFVGLLLGSCLFVVSPLLGQGSSFSAFFSLDGKIRIDGTKENPFLIRSFEEFTNFAIFVNNRQSYGINGEVRGYHEAYYRLENNIKLPESYEHMPIGIDLEHAFSGGFDGRGHRIADLSFGQGARGELLLVDAGRSNEEHVGLFGVLSNARVINLILSNTKIKTKKSSVATGALAGTAINTFIDNVTIEESVIEGVENVGGVVGVFASENGKDSTMLATISDAKVKGTRRIGGLIGFAYATKMYPPSRYSNDNRREAGTTTIFENLATGSIYGETSVGGLIGEQGSFHNGSTFVIRSAALGNVTGENKAIGGLVGTLNAGMNATSSVLESITRGEVRGGDDTGGLIGWQEALLGGAIYVRKTVATGDVSGDKRVGGLIGGSLAMSRGTITLDLNAALGLTSGKSQVGGLVGQNYAGRHVSRATHDRSKEMKSWVKIASSFAVGSVSADRYAGGLIGENAAEAESTIEVLNSFSLSVVVGESMIGGLIGVNSAGPGGGNIRLSYNYAAGLVSGKSYVGGLLGRHFVGPDGAIDISASYWNVPRSKLSVSAGGEADQHMQDFQTSTSKQSIFSQWESQVWDLGTKNEYPVLRGLLSPLTPTWQRRFLALP